MFWTHVALYRGVKLDMSTRLALWASPPGVAATESGAAGETLGGFTGKAAQGRPVGTVQQSARAKARRRGQSRGDYVLEPVYWDAGTARLLKGRTRGPVFATGSRAEPGRS